MHTSFQSLLHLRHAGLSSSSARRHAASLPQAQLAWPMASEHTGPWSPASRRSATWSTQTALRAVLLYRLSTAWQANVGGLPSFSTVAQISLQFIVQVSTPT